MTEAAPGTSIEARLASAGLPPLRRTTWLEIDVDATAFRAVEMTSEGNGRERRIALGLDSGDALILGREHPLKIVPTAGGPSHRILVRHELEAELVRSVYYELAELALAEGHDPPGIWSNGLFFSLEQPT